MSPLPAGKSPRRSARQAILDAATIVLAESPDSPMSAVSEAAGVGRATLYRHFPSREDLIKALSLDAIRATDEAVAPVFDNYSTADKALREMLEVLIPLGDRYHFLSTESGLSAEPEIAAEYQRQYDETAAFVEQAKEEKLFDPALPTAWITAAIDALIWAAWNTVHRGEIAPRDVAGMTYRTLVNGMGPQD